MTIDTKKLQANRDALIQMERALFEHAKQLPQSHACKYLHLGCADRILEGFTNIDRYNPAADTQDDLATLRQIKNSTIELIYCMHALEHLPLRIVPIALKRWYDILIPGGEVYLAMPDLYLCAKYLLETKHEGARTWIKYCIYGYQAPPASGDAYTSLDEGQFHNSGYGMEEMILLMNKTGFEVVNHFQYDGWGTPSYFLHSLKK